MIIAEQPTNLGTADMSDGQTSSALGDIVEAIARQVHGFAEHRRGDLAELRRMDPESPDAPALWRVLAHHDIYTDGRNQEYERSWSLIVHGIALMTPNHQTQGARAYAHNHAIPIGKALFLGSEPSRSSAFYSEQRLSRLLTARGSMLHALLARLFRMCASNSVSFDWREMAWFILNDAHYEDQAEESRRKIAREYYRAERRYSQTPSDNEDQ